MMCIPSSMEKYRFLKKKKGILERGALGIK
jgi:hypothetical protein